MKRLFAFVAALLFIACNSDDVYTPTNKATRFHAIIEDASTRTFVDENIRLRWTAEDLITLFEGTTRNKKYKFLGETGDNAGDFEDITTGFGSGNDVNRYYALYPYASTTKLHEDGYITYTLPAEQTYAENSFGLGANPMVAVTEDKNDYDLSFKNVCGYLRLYLYGEDVTIKSITIEGNDSEPIAGKVIITPTYGGNPTIEMDATATTTVTLNCGEGVAVGSTAETSTPFWIVLPPTTFADGFTLTITDTNDNEFTKSISSNVNIQRNKYLSARIEVEFPKPVPNNQIWYTTSNQALILLNNDKANEYFGANIVSNTYEDGKGVVTFDGDVVKITKDALRPSNSWEYNYLSTITLPESVEYVEENIINHCFIGEFYGKFASEDHLLLISNDTIVACSSSFGGNKVISEYTIPNGVIRIGDGAFQRVNLTVINMPNSVKSIGEDAFFDCDLLTTVNLSNSLEIVGTAAFANCDKLNYILLPASVRLFESTSKYSYSGGAQFGNSGLIDIAIPEGVLEIPIRAFCGCTQLASVSIPEGVKKIDTQAFSGCNSLTTITLPSSMEYIGNSAFETLNLEELNIKAITPPITNGGIYGVGKKDVKIKVPSISVDAYKTADGWKGYADYIEAGEF